MCWKFFSGVLVLLLLTACAANTGKKPLSQADSDGDGIIDSFDKCPQSAQGVVVDAEGCGIDSDLDGVFDYLDHCPDTVFNIPVDTHGCPLDSDGDGVSDDRDRCGDTPDVSRVDMYGCPVKSEKKVQKAEPSPQLELLVLFRTGSADLLPGNDAEFLRGADFVKRFPGSRVIVEGHTDGVGPADYNQTLSVKRAEIVSRELKARLKGDAPEITILGYGETRPIASNETQKGREQNRRVVIRIEAGS